MDVIRTESELEPRLGEEEVLPLTFTAAWELMSTRASIEVELKKPKQAPSEAARHTLQMNWNSRGFSTGCLDKENIFK